MPAVVHVGAAPAAPRSTLSTLQSLSFIKRGSLFSSEACSRSRSPGAPGCGCYSAPHAEACGYRVRKLVTMSFIFLAGGWSPTWMASVGTSFSTTGNLALQP